jgi:hypothetical protein
MKLYNEDKSMEFDFTGFRTAEDYDVTANKFDGSSIVDFAAESDDVIVFIEAKNFVRHSTDSDKQLSIDRDVARSLAELRDEVGYARKMIKKFEHSLFIWVACGGRVDKPVCMILAFNPPREYKSRERTRLLERLNKYIPPSVVESGLMFGVPLLGNTPKRYGFSVTVQ